MRAFGIVVLASALAIGGCSKKPAEITITDGVVRLSPNPKTPSVAYFTLHGGATDDRLLDVTSPVVIRTEMHESMTTGGPSTGSGGSMASMKPLEGGVALPAGGTVRFEPGGKHVMLFGINPGITSRETIQMQFTFASGLQLQSYIKTRAPGQL